MDVTGSTPGSVLFTTYNVLDLGADDSAAGAEHYKAVVESIQALRTDVLAVQEIRGPDVPAARQLMLRLADDTGLRCLVPRPGGDPAPALCPGSRGYHLGLLWRDGIEPVPGTFRSRNSDFWHALGWITLDLGGPAVRHAVYHAPPFGRKIRVDQNELLVASLARPRDRVPTLVGADWNGESADRIRDPATGRWHLYEPGDPYADVDWFDDLVHQCEWDYDEQGRRRDVHTRHLPGDLTELLFLLFCDTCFRGPLLALYFGGARRHFSFRDAYLLRQSLVVGFGGLHPSG